MAATDIQENVLRSLYELQNNSKVFTTNKALYEKALEKYMVSVPVLSSLRIFHVDIRTPRGTPRRRRRSLRTNQKNSRNPRNTKRKLKFSRLDRRRNKTH